MDKIRLNILGLSYSQTQSGAYALVLAEEDGTRRIPIIIGASEAQSIAIQLEGLTPLRPLTHDLFLSLAKSFSITLVEVNITKLEEGIFYSELVCKQNHNIIRIDARTSDAVALAIRFNSSIYTNETILDKAGIVLEQDLDEQYTPNKQQDKKNATKTIFGEKTLDELEVMLSEAIEKEDYELASKIRDEINKFK